MPGANGRLVDPANALALSQPFVVQSNSIHLCSFSFSPIFFIFTHPLSLTTEICEATAHAPATLLSARSAASTGLELEALTRSSFP
ncbi:hypothetical protein CcaverHIS641_0310040 [Cutaneotrichosporon cavernicola]|nr:hypothetical protein CcaverHIS641_0310040 [Cutaneotrichosporon cavernicola]